MDTRRDRGATAVEFAIVMPLLILLVFGIVQFAIVFNRQQALHAAAREAARLGSLSQTTLDEISTRANDSLAGVSFDPDPSITITPGSAQPCNLRSGETVTVTLEATTDLDIPLFGSPTITLTGRGEFQCE